MAAGSEREFEALVRAHQAVVCATAYSVLRDRGRAEEVAQDAFLVAWQKLPALAESPPAMPGWICGIARNLARNAARKKREVAVEDERDAVAEDAGPLGSLLTKESQAIAHRALASLDEREREAITVYFMGDGQHADVARALGITEANARQRVHRARTKLRDAVSAVEATLRAARPGPAFTAACVAALAVGKAVDADAARNATAGAKPVIGTAGLTAAGAAAVLAVITVVVAVRARSTSTPSTPAGSAGVTTTSSTADAVAVDRAAGVRRMSPQQRDELVARLHAAGASLATAPTSTSTPAAAGSDPDKTKVYDFSGGPLEGGKPVDPPPPDASPKRFIRYAIQEIQPLLVECHHGLPSSGTLAMRIVLVGAPGVGTIVESVQIDNTADEGSAVAFEESFTECMRETLYAIELPPMATTDRWDVRYPFVVTPSP